MGNLPSVVSTLSFFIPGMAVAKGASAIARIAGMGAKAGKMFSGVVGGLSSRYMESSMEASQLAQQFQGNGWSTTYNGSG